jgi:ribonuclease-3
MILSAPNIEYEFRDSKLLGEALTHRSYSKHNNERLEYLGDAILGFVIAEALYDRFPGQPEGVLTRLRSTLVKRETLAGLSRDIELGEYIRLGPGEMKSGGWRRDSILSNTMEALIGAIYLDSDMDTCKFFILGLYQELLASISPDKLNKDSKTLLQEYLQAKKQELPVYEIIEERGDAHNREFVVSCRIADVEHEITASGRSRRSAEQSAAKKALKLLQI